MIVIVILIELVTVIENENGIENEDENEDLVVEWKQLIHQMNVNMFYPMEKKFLIFVMLMKLKKQIKLNYLMKDLKYFVYLYHFLELQ